MLMQNTEANLANNAAAYRAGQHPGYVSTALDGITQTIELANEKRIKIILNGGSLNPKGLAQKMLDLAMPTNLTGLRRR